MDPMNRDALAQQRTDFARLRTLIAAERTLMAWIRTAISMIGFGFTIYQFFRYLAEAQGLARPHAAQNLGLTLIALGTLVLIAAVFQHRQMLARLGDDARSAYRSLAFPVAILMILIGVFVFFSVLSGFGPY
ncbi:hypothetical protein D3C86_700410 [compost metagenome]